MTTKAVNRTFHVTVLVDDVPKGFTMVVPAATTKKAARQSVIARFGKGRVKSVK